ncbi:MAG TPA: prolyl oligopeptidase family serine peptidase [Terriglobales bacterium]|nr:prolyl oligopeptidase family serine peptidase [Terriglobales bacterium]
MKHASVNRPVRFITEALQLAIRAMFRTRFSKDIVTEFLPPARTARIHKVIVLCDGMPSIPHKQNLALFLSRKGYWVFYPRYRGAWESGGSFLNHSPHEDILEVLGGLSKPLVEIAFGKRFLVRVSEAFVIGGSFGGAAAILCSRDSRVKKVVANCPVVDWAILSHSERAETSNSNYAAYIRESFGNAYRLSDQNWKKLSTGKFYNPAYHADDIEPSKVIMFHAKDDPYVPYASVKHFADRTRIKLKSFRHGGHLSTEYIVKKYWRQISAFFNERSSDG